jgi:hypothetical protein
LIEPLYPRGGLLGGNPDSSNSKPGKMSKLAALAAARKAKADTSVATEIGKVPDSNSPKSDSSAPAADDEKRIERKFPRRVKPKEEPNPSTKTEESNAIKHPETTSILRVNPLSSGNSPSELLDKPSILAKTIFELTSSDQANEEKTNDLTFIYFQEPKLTRWLTSPGPSPDDKVKAAQSGAEGTSKRSRLL